MEITRGRGYVYSIQYHIVWCVKYRYPILTNVIEEDLINILNKIAEDNNYGVDIFGIPVILLLLYQKIQKNK